MDPREIWNLLRKQPFEAFVLRLHDGRAIEIRHPEVVVPGARSIYVGLYHQPRDGPVDDWVMLSPVAIASAHPIAQD